MTSAETDELLLSIKNTELALYELCRARFKMIGVHQCQVTDNKIKELKITLDHLTEQYVKDDLTITRQHYLQDRPHFTSPDDFRGMCLGFDGVVKEGKFGQTIQDSK